MSNEGGGGKQTFHSIESMKDLVMQWKGTSTIILVDQRIGSCSTFLQTSKYVSQNSINILFGHQLSLYPRSSLEHLNIQC